MSGLLCVHKSPSNETKIYEFYLGKGTLLLKPRACFLPTIPRAIPRVVSEINRTLKCGVFDVFCAFGLKNVVLQTVLFSYNPTFTDIAWCGGNVNIVRCQVLGQNF